MMLVTNMRTRAAFHDAFQSILWLIDAVDYFIESLKTIIHCGTKKTAPFYFFFNNFVETFYSEISIGT